MRVKLWTVNNDLSLPSFLGCFKDAVLEVRWRDGASHTDIILEGRAMLDAIVETCTTFQTDFGRFVGIKDGYLCLAFNLSESAQGKIETVDAHVIALGSIVAINAYEYEVPK